MAEQDERFQRSLVTKSRLVEDLRRLGLCPGEVVMLHASVSAIGWVVGGPDMVIQALLDVLGPEGTLMMYVGWEDDPYKLTEWPEEWQRAYLEECPLRPPKIPSLSEVEYPHRIFADLAGRLPERPSRGLGSRRRCEGPMAHR